MLYANLHILTPGIPTRHVRYVHFWVWIYLHKVGSGREQPEGQSHHHAETGVIRLAVGAEWIKYRGLYPTLDTGVDSLMYRHMLVH